MKGLRTVNPSLLPMQKGHLLLFVGIAVSVSAVQLLAPKPGARIPPDQANPKIEELEKNWAQASYLAIGSSDELTNAISRLAVSKSEIQLTSSQEESLRGSILAFLMCYRETSFDAYESFRGAAPHRLDLRAMQPIYEYLLKQQAITTSTSFGSEREQLKTIWEAYHSLFSTNQPHQISGIDPNDVHIRVSRLKEVNKAGFPRIPRHYTGKWTEMSKDVFVYEENPSTMIQRNGSYVYAIVGMVVQTAQRKFTPLYVGFFWSNRGENWVPWKLWVTDHRALICIL